MTLMFAGTNTAGQYAIGEIFYTGIYCYSYPACTPDTTIGWHAQIPGSEPAAGVPPAQYELTLTVIDGPCVPYAQFFVNSATKHHVNPMVLAAIAAHESGNYDAVFGSNPNAGAGPPGGKGLMQVDTTAGPSYVRGLPDSTTLDPAWNIEAGAKIFADGQPGCRASQSPMIVAYNAGGNCSATDGYYPACHDDQGRPNYYLNCVNHHLVLLKNAGYNFDCAGPAQSPPVVGDRIREKFMAEAESIRTIIGSYMFGERA